MKILQLHTRYVTSPGGEDVVLDMERELLLSRGHRVERHLASNAAAAPSGPASAVAAALRAVWNPGEYRVAVEAISRFSPDVVHVHNTFAAMSPSVLWAASRAGVPVVLTLHNYRLVCPVGTLLRDDAPCEECVGRLPWPALAHRCRYGGSLSVTAVVAATQAFHRLIGTWARRVDAYVALTDFAASIMVRGGFPAGKIHVKPNFVWDESPPPPPGPRPHDVIFAGQVLRAKGADLLLDAWLRLPPSGARLVFAGDGADREELVRRSAGRDDVVWLGKIPRDEVAGLMGGSRFLVLPSRWYEGFPLVLLESLSKGTPVIVPDHGAFPSVVTRGKDAILFRPADAASLAEALRQALSMEEDRWGSFSSAAREECASRYSAEENHARLMKIYDRAAEEARRRISGGRP